MSTTAVWVRTQLPGNGSGLPAETEQMPLRDILPVDALPGDIKLPATISEDTVCRYRDRLRAHQEEERAYELLSSASYRIEDAVPSDVLTMAERLWFGDEHRPFSDACDAARQIAGRLEAWERTLQLAEQNLCRDILGVGIDDIVLVTVGGKPVRMRVDQLFVHDGESGISFSIYGTRFRKDGVLGKRGEFVALTIENTVKQTR